MIEDIIQQYNNRDSLYGNKLTNHLNMGLFALNKMGADDKRLYDFAQYYISKTQLPLLPSVKIRITETNFYDYLGCDSYYSSFIPFFKEQLADSDIDTVVGKFVNILINGSAGGAYHGLIRLAYAYELQNTDELAKALAYFAEAYQEFPILQEISPSRVLQDPLSTVTDLAGNAYFRSFKFNRPLIIGRMIDVYEDPQFFSVVSDIGEELCNSEYFSGLLLNMYALTEDFTILHGFTSTHALRVLSHLITDYRAALRQHWFTLQLAYLSTGCTPLKEIKGPEKSKIWAEIFEEAVKKNDVHTLKFVYSLCEQSKLFADDRPYRSVVQKHLQS